MSDITLIVLTFLLYLNGICDGVENVMPSVTTPLGQIEGYVGLTVNSNPFYKFEGVPYAKPPVGELRFEDPEDIEPWTGIRNATVLTQCMQYDQFTKDSQNNYVVHGDEDCLHVNIYTHTTKRTANIDVLFHIHGGAYSYGSGGGYGPEIIMDRNIVFVNMNYRLGPLGFTSTEDDVLPGNIGLKDQIKALKWVKKYIKYFGGNPEAITIYGFSAGAASVHLHYLIPASKGLFKKGFSQSGSALNPWVLAENTREKTAKVADLVGCPANNSTEIKECLKTKPARDIVGTMRAFQPFLYNPFSPFGVVVDGKWAKNPTLPDHPYKLIKQGKVQDLPWIISHTRNEGVYPGGDFLTDERLLEIDTRWNELLPFILDYNYTIDPILKDVVSQKIRQEYFQNEPVNNDTFSTLRDVLTDRIFLADIEKAARLHSSVVKSNVFSYAFYYKGTDSFAEVLTGSTQNLGVSHGDDVLLILKLGYNFTKSELSTEADKLTSKLLIDTIISFMKEGSPNITTIWEPLSKNPRDDYRELQINRYDDLQLLPKKYIGRSPFWDSLPFQENDKLFKVKNNV